MFKRKHHSTDSSEEEEVKRRKREKKQRLIQDLQRQREFFLPWCQRYEQVVEEIYSNFVLQQKDDITSALHGRIQWAFETLRDHGYLYQDRVKINKKTITTPVSRTLIGEPGLTYKYLNLRLFTLPWSFAGRPPSNDIEEACSVFRELNNFFCERSKLLMVKKLAGRSRSEQSVEQETEDLVAGKNNNYRDMSAASGNSTQEEDDDVIERNSNFNITLLNYMDPSDMYLKDEPYYGMGRLAVSWHSDENLVEGSTVAVYNHTCYSARPEQDEDWKVGLKVAWNTEIPAILTPVCDGQCYYMLDTMNDTHLHCVLAGSTPRFSSTHRLTKCTSLSDIQKKSQKALENLNKNENGCVSLKSLDLDVIQFSEEIHDEVEFEWLRQFWMQGAKHSQEREYWIQPMEELESQWRQMELMTKLTVNAAMEEKNKSLIQKLLCIFTKRQSLRDHWMNRFSGRDICQIPSEHTPDYRPYWTDTDDTYPLPFDLADIMQQLESIEEEPY